MKSNARVQTEAPQAGTSLDSNVLENVVQFVPALWATLHRAGRSPVFATETRNRIHQVLGAMPGIWAVLLQLGERKFKNADERKALYRAVLEESNARHTLPREMCNLIGILASRWQAMNAEHNEGDINDLMSQAFWGLVDTGIFSQVPNTFRNPEVFGESLFRYCSGLKSFWVDANRFAGNAAEVRSARTLVSRVTALPLFDAVRQQRTGQQATSVGQLMLWFQTPQARRERGFYASVAQGIHELGVIRAELDAAIAKAPKADRVSLRRARRMVEKNTIALVLTGILSVVPA